MLVTCWLAPMHSLPTGIPVPLWTSSPKNADAVMRAVRRFGAPIHNLTKEDLQRDGTIFQIGVAPRRIDIITSASGLQFKETFARSITVDIDGVKVNIPSIDDLIQNKRSTGRTKDLADVEALESLKNSEQ